MKPNQYGFSDLWIARHRINPQHAQVAASHLPRVLHLGQSFSLCLFNAKPMLGYDKGSDTEPGYLFRLC